MKFIVIINRLMFSNHALKMVTLVLFNKSGCNQNIGFLFVQTIKRMTSVHWHDIWKSNNKNEDKYILRNFLLSFYIFPINKLFYFILFYFKKILFFPFCKRVLEAPHYAGHVKVTDMITSCTFVFISKSIPRNNMYTD